MSVRFSMSHKPIQRDKLYETSAGRLVTFWCGIDFSMPYLCCCWLLVATGWLWAANCSAVSYLTSVWLMIQWDCCSPGLLNSFWLEAGLWLEIWTDQYGGPPWEVWECFELSSLTLILGISLEMYNSSIVAGIERGIFTRRAENLPGQLSHPFDWG